MRIRTLLLVFLAALGCAAGQEKLGDNSKVFGRKPPKDGKLLIRSVTGTVQDVNGNAVTGATVYLADTKTKKERAIVADNKGGYRFDDLSTAIDYRLRAAKDKLESPWRTLSSFDPRRDPVMNLTVEAKPAAKK